MHAPTIPPCHMRREADQVRDDDAWDVAREVVARAKSLGMPIALLVLPAGEVQFHPIDQDDDGATLELSSLSIVGVYTAAADPADVHDDLIAMPRGWECAP